MAYSHQLTEIKMFGSGNTELVLTSGTSATKTRHIVTQSCVLRKVTLWPLVVGVTAGKPTLTVRKVTGPASSTATGTAVSGATLTLPAAQPIGRIVERSKLSTKFDAGDHIIVAISTAATKAFTARVSCWVEPTWEQAANIPTKMTTVTA